MKRIGVGIGLLIAVVCVGGCARQGPHADAEKAAVKAAQDWLALVDAGNYKSSWDGAAAIFKSQVSEAAWAQSATAVRSPLGKLQYRRLEALKYSASLPGAPAGEFVEVRFEATFEHKPNAIETVTPMREADGSWKVSGYFIN